MKLWIDDIRPAPEGYIWVKSVNEAKSLISENIAYAISHILEECIIDTDHDAGEFANDGGDYVKLFDWLEMVDINDVQVLGDIFKYHIHSQNPVGVENMRRIIRRNGWKEI